MASVSRPAVPRGHLVMAGTATLLKAVTAPLDRTCTLLICQQDLVKVGCLAEPYAGIKDCMVKVYNTEGLASFWRGGLIGCVIHVPMQAANFALKNYFAKTLPAVCDGDGAVKSVGKNVLMGVAAGAAVLTIFYPFALAQTKLEGDVKASSPDGDDEPKYLYSGMLDVFRKTTANQGFLGLYRGFAVSLVGISVYRGVYFALFDAIKPSLQDGKSRMTVGFVVAVISGIMSYPFDVIRRRMIVNSGQSHEYDGYIDCARQIYEHEGLIAFWAGLPITLVKGVLNAMLMGGVRAMKPARQS